MAASFKPLSDVLGAEVLGIDLHRPIADNDAAALRQALLDYHVLLVRQPDVTDREHMTFCETFGDIQAERTVPDAESGQVAGMMHVSNVRDDGILPNGEMWFHSDQCYFDTPCKCTSLYGIETPKSGGFTRFSNCIAAYNDLPPATKARLDGLVGMNVYDYASPNMNKKTADRTPDAPQYAQPLIRSHTETGAKSIYVNRLMTDSILDIDEAESRTILEDLFTRIEDERYVYEHPWQPGDLVIWDNRCLVHARTDFDSVEPRLLRRFSVTGEKPA